jgi:hypothetical protein
MFPSLETRMQLERLGVVGFFGVFVPGAYLAAFVLLFLACLLELNASPGTSYC